MDQFEQDVLVVILGELRRRYSDDFLRYISDRITYLLFRREWNRRFNRQLRDISNPFETPEENFRKDFRFTRELAWELFNEMGDHFALSRRNTNIPPVIKFFIALHFFAHGSYQKSMAKDKSCAMSQSSVSRCIHEVSEILVDHFAPRYIKFPTELPDIIEVKNGFFEKYNFPGVIGAIDATHIKIFPPPSLDPVMPGRVFVNRKNFHSINCQVICDSNLRLLSIDARYPGSVHDAAIWRMSRVRSMLLINFNNGDRTTWLLGDSGYPLSPFLMTPLVGAERDSPEGRYTAQQIMSRNTVERCIGVLKSYFRCLSHDRTLHYAPQFAAKIIYSCAVLYNVLRIHGIEFNDIPVDVEDPVVMPEEIPEPDLLEQGRIIRNNIIEQFQ